MKRTTLFLTAALLALPFFARADQGDPVSLQTMLIDVPTAEVLDKYQASLLTRTYSEGSVMETIDFGVISRVNIGVSLAVHELLGNSDDIKVLSPDFQVKWKIFDGNLYLPAIAIGYDGRRYGYNRQTKKYLDDRKGGYLVMTREIIWPSFNATLGANLSDFDKNDFYVFSGLSYTIADVVGLMAEWDNINTIRESRFNAGVRFYLHPSLSLDGAVRRLGRGDENERIMQLRFVTNF